MSCATLFLKALKRLSCVFLLTMVFRSDFVISTSIVMTLVTTKRMGLFSARGSSIKKDRQQVLVVCCQPFHDVMSAVANYSLFTFHFSLFTFHFSLFTFHFRRGRSPCSWWCSVPWWRRRWCCRWSEGWSSTFPFSWCQMVFKWVNKFNFLK